MSNKRVLLGNQGSGTPFPSFQANGLALEQVCGIGGRLGGLRSYYSYGVYTDPMAIY